MLTVSRRDPQGPWTLERWLVISLQKAMQLSSLPVLLFTFLAIPLTAPPFHLPPGSLDASGDSNFSNSSVFTITRWGLFIASQG